MRIASVAVLLLAACAGSMAPAARAAVLTAAPQLPADTQIAGVTSVSRISPVLNLQSNGVGGASETLYDGTTLFSGVSFTQFAVDVSTAGTLHVRLDDLEFPVLAGALSFALTDGGAVLGVLSGEGLLDLEIAGPARLYAFVYAVGVPGAGVGSYYLNLAMQPIPLPASLWLLLGGALWSGWLGRRRRALVSSDTDAA